MSWEYMLIEGLVRRKPLPLMLNEEKIRKVRNYCHQSQRGLRLSTTPVLHLTDFS